MSARGVETELQQRLKLIVQELDGLPTLSSIAIRLLEATGSQTSHAREVIALVAADPALSSKVLQLCRRADRGVNIRDGGIDRAVILLGFEEVRSLAVAVEVFELMDGLASPGGERHAADAGAFDRRGFWIHSIAVGVAAEALVRESRLKRGIGAGEAFLAGLLHDLGHLALARVLPETFDRICAVAQARSASIDDVCRRVVGVSTHTVGKHLGDHWGLPRSLLDVIWLCEQTGVSIPELASRPFVQVVTLADAIARRNMLGCAGHGPTDLDPESLAAELSIRPAAVRRVSESLIDAVAERAAGLGLHEATSRALVREAFERANAIVGTASNERSRIDAQMRTRSRALNAADEFCRKARAAGTLGGVIDAVLKSAAMMFGDADAAIVALRPSGMIDVFASDAHGARLSPLTISTTADSQAKRALDFDVAEGRPAPSLTNAIAVAAANHDRAPAFAWLESSAARALGESDDARFVFLFAGLSDAVIEQSHADVLFGVWSVALAAAGAREQAERLAERLVEANRELVASQELLAEKRAMAALGELAAGAAHEMNNPLTVISGRSQMLARKLEGDPALSETAREVSRQARRLSDLITALRLYAEHPHPRPQVVCVPELVRSLLEDVQREFGTRSIEATIPDRMPPARFDPVQIAQVLREVIRNAIEAGPGNVVSIRTQIDPSDDRLLFEVIDNGCGLSERALKHAFDPFFSEKPAGRQPGLGLARARRLAELGRGTLALKNRSEGGAVATLTLTDWRAPMHAAAA